MCYPKPGPRCTPHARKTKNRAKIHMEQTLADDTSSETQKTLARQAYIKAALIYDSTPGGQKEIEKKLTEITNENKKRVLQKRLEDGKELRRKQMETYHSETTGDMTVNDKPGYKTIYISVNGSRLYGTHHEESDHDAIGVFLVPAEQKLGLEKVVEDSNTRNVPQHTKSDNDTIESTNFELTKYVKLCLGGNPNVIPTLYSDENKHQKSEYGSELLKMRDKIISRNIIPKFKGMTYSQLMRLEGKGTKQATMPNRPDLVEKHGYDTKYASTAYRTAIMGRELAETGKLQLPLQRADEIVRMRNGEYSLEEAIRMTKEELEHMEKAEKTSPLPEQPDYDAVNKFIIETYKKYYKI